MKKLLTISLVLLNLFGFKTDNLAYQSNNNTFSKELHELKNLFHIPGMAVIVKNGNKTIFEDYMGLADVKNNISIDSTTVFPMASLTKIFSAILVMKLVEDHKLSLEESINKYITQQGVGDSIKVKHVLSHTSQGQVGKSFYYSGRYSWLTKVIEKASGNTFEKEMNEKIIQPLGLKRTFLLKDSLQISNGKIKLARPYYYEGQVTDGFVDYGFSSASGIASTVRDLARLSKALNENELISKESKKIMFSPSSQGLPYGYGIFSQKFQGISLIWGYGQYDCYSSLFLKIPEKNLTCIITANNNLMSDPPRLIYGDLSYSLFAISFLKNYALNLPNEPLLENSASLNTLSNRITTKNSEFYRKKLLAQAIAESFLARFENGKSQLSEQILDNVFKKYPDYEKYGDLTLMHNLSFLKTVARYKENKDFTKFDAILEKIGTKLLLVDNENPYANYYMADYYGNKGSNEFALVYYNKILSAKNFSRHWYTTQAENWVKANKK